MDELSMLRDKLSKFRDVESGIWTYLNEDPINHYTILKEHSKLQSYITELYTEISFVGKEHDLFEHMKTDSGRNISELLRVLRNNLLRQYDDLLKLKDTQDRMRISEILNGDKNGQNESETSQTIRKIETELMNVQVNPTVVSTYIPKPEDIESPKINKSMSYDDSLKRLRAAGFKRHLRPLEWMKIHNLPDHDGDPYGKICSDVFSSTYPSKPPEWLSIAVKLDEDGLLHVALDPENIVLKGDHYEWLGSPRCSSMRTYPNSGFKYGELNFNYDRSRFGQIFGGFFIELSHGWNVLAILPGGYSTFAGGYDGIKIESFLKATSRGCKEK